MINMKKSDHSAVTVKSRAPVYSKIVPQVSENFRHPIFSYWSVP